MNNLNKPRLLVGLILLVALAALAVVALQPPASPAAPETPVPLPAATTSPVVLLNPATNGLVASPLIVRGRAPGTWFFEGSLPVRLETLGGEVLATAPAQAEGEWMTTNTVPFSATLVFSPPAEIDEAVLVVAKDNPSGLPANDELVRFPVRLAGNQP
jgi:hypothetical protein